MNGLLDRVEALLALGKDLQIESDKLVLSPLEAEERPESTLELERRIDERLPLVELSESPEILTRPFQRRRLTARLSRHMKSAHRFPEALGSSM